MKRLAISLLLGMAAQAGCSPPTARADSAKLKGAVPAGCVGLPDAATLQGLLVQASHLSDPPLGGRVGGIFEGARMWAAVVGRGGELCAWSTSTTDPTQVWPGSQAIAKAKAYTANGFSVDTLPLSTAELYTFAQPGHSLYGLNQSNPFDPRQLVPPGAATGQGDIAGGIVTFGGGVPIYKGGAVVGGLGVSGDTACADHEIAKRVRHLAALDPPGGATQDDISYPPDGPSVYLHPLCPNTYRNGRFIGNESPATHY